MGEINDKPYEMDDDTQKNKYLTFSIGNESYGIEIQCVTEIIGIQSITEIPELPKYIKGIINLRGKIIPVMDIRLRFKKEEKEYNDRTCIIVIDIQDVSIGLIVDSVSEVITIQEDEMEEPPRINNDFQNRYVQYIGKVDNEIKLLLDCNKLLADDELDMVETLYK